MPANDGGLGSHLVGDKITMGGKSFHVTKLLGEGGFSYVYLVKELPEGGGLSSSLHVDSKKEKAAAAAAANGDDPAVRRGSGQGRGEKSLQVLKVTSIHSRSQRDIAEKEAKLLSRLSHPSIVKMYDTCYRTVAHTGSNKKASSGHPSAPKERPQHLILMEYCEGGHALDVCSKLASAGSKFDLPTLIIAFGQICNAVSYLHAQRPPIVHRDLKPVNFLVKNGAYKLCDFGSAVFGHVDLRTPKARAEAEEVIEKTTTQMFRAPEMVDLYMAKKLTQATDVWALGACLYQLAFLQNCFEEGSNLAILSRKYTIPEDNPFGEGLVELLDRMLTVDSKARADMTEVILCLSAVYSNRPLPPRKKSSRASRASESSEGGSGSGDQKKIGSFRTDGQGIQQPVYDPTKATEGKKLASNSVAARRKRAAASAGTSALPPTAPSSTGVPPAPSSGNAPSGNASDPLDFSNFEDKNSDAAAAFGSEAAFGQMKGFETKDGDATANDFFGSFDNGAGKEAGAADANNAFDAAFAGSAWGDEGKGAPSSAEGAKSAPSSEQAQQQPETPAAAPSSEGVPQDALENENNGEANGNDDDKRESPSDAQRKDRSRRRRAGGTSSRSNNTGSRTGSMGVEGGVEAMNISSEGSAAAAAAGSSSGGDGDKKDRRSRAPRSAEGEGEHRRRRSTSRNRRKGRPTSSRSNIYAEGGAAAPGEGEKKPAKKGLFRRNKSPAPGPPPDP